MGQERTVPTDNPLLTPALLWRELPAAKRLALAEPFWTDEDSMPQQVEAVQAIASHLHFRPQSVVKLAPEKLARHLASVHRVSEGLAGRLLVVYHLTRQRPMLESFLNALGIAHENGLIAEAAAHTPEPAALQAAADTLRAQFPADDVRLYLRTLAAQDPDTWGGLLPIVSAWPAA
jgi:hypothetical protein